MSNGLKKYIQLALVFLNEATYLRAGSRARLQKVETGGQLAHLHGGVSHFGRALARHLTQDIEHAVVAATGGRKRGREATSGGVGVYSRSKSA